MLKAIIALRYFVVVICCYFDFIFHLFISNLHYFRKSSHFIFYRIHQIIKQNLYLLFYAIDSNVHLNNEIGSKMKMDSSKLLIEFIYI